MTLGRILSVEILRPGKAAMIAKNGWPCSYRECKAEPTVEIRFTRSARGNHGYMAGSHGTCDEHAEDYARLLGADIDTRATEAHGE